MLMTGKDYLDSIRDGRRVYVGGERVEDVTTHPAFRNAARSFAMIYDRKRAAALADEQFTDLHGIRRGAFAEIVAHAPEGDPVFAGQILSHAADEYVVLAAAVKRHGVLPGGQFIYQGDALGRGE